MKRTISDEEAKEHFGIVAAHEQMPNGELRFRLFGSDGNGYIRTVATETGGWQKSHLHSTFRELYLVEFGWMAMATLGHDPNIPEIRIFHPGTQVHLAFRPDSQFLLNWSDGDFHHQVQHSWAYSEILI